MILVNLLENTNKTKMQKLTAFLITGIPSILLLGFLFASFIFSSCSPGPSNKTIHGKDVTELFFFKYVGEYKNGTYKHLKFYNENNFSKKLYQQNVIYSDYGYALKTSSGYKIVKPDDTDYNNTARFSYRFECKKTYTGEINRVEEIPTFSSDDNLSREFKSAQSNPIPLKFFIYPSAPEKEEYQITNIYEPMSPQFSPEELEKLKSVLQIYCSISYKDHAFNDLFQSYNYNNDQRYFALTEIAAGGFVLINSDSVTSNSKITYQPANGYYKSNKFSILRDIEFFNENSEKKSLTMAETNYVQAETTDSTDFLAGKYKNKPNDFNNVTIDIENIAQTYKMTLATKDPQCGKSFRLGFTISDLEIISRDNKRTAILKNAANGVSNFDYYINSDLDSQVNIEKIELLAESTPPADSQTNCVLWDKLNSIKGQNKPIKISLSYDSYYKQLSVLIMDSDFNRLALFTQLPKSNN